MSENDKVLTVVRDRDGPGEKADGGIEEWRNSGMAEWRNGHYTNI